MTRPGYRGRFAPSPTGPLHLGSLVAALGSWLLARKAGGEWLVRIEDIDPPRERPGMAENQLETLSAFGLESDFPVVWQSARGAAYNKALQALLASGNAFECGCSRSDLANSAGVHRACLATSMRPAASIRLRVPDVHIGFEDALQGHFEQDMGRDIGDVVLRRADGFWAYHLAVVVDDAEQGITHVVRGADLLDSTPRQILLQQKLGLPTPEYSHLPVVWGEDGLKLSKSLAGLPVSAKDPLPALRAAFAHLGQDAAVLAGRLLPGPALLLALAAFDPERIPRSGQTRPASNQN